MYVASVSYGCCKSSRDVAHVAIVVHICCKLLFSMFHLFFSDVCCKCVYLDVAYVFTHMMQVFYLDVAHVYNGFKCFLVVFCNCFRRMFQIFNLFSDVCCNCCIWMFQN
jgi:hypothetical protein